jgi:hypothetical protein
MRLSELSNQKMLLSNASAQIGKALSFCIAHQASPTPVARPRDAGSPEANAPPEVYVFREPPPTMNMEGQVAWYNAELKRLSSAEKVVDIEMDGIRSKGAALGRQLEEFQKYLADGIKMSFKNMYV